MPKFYITFGQVHVHRVNGKTFDCDCVGVYEAKHYKEARKKAFEWFDDKFFTVYEEADWDETSLKFFPRGYLNVENN